MRYLFGAEWITLVVCFDFRYGHGWKWFAEDMSHIFIFFFGDIVPGVSSIVQSEVFLHVGFIPDFFIVGRHFGMMF